MPLPQMCIFKSCLLSSTGDLPSAVSPPGSETPQGRAHARGDHPCLCYEDHYRLYHGLRGVAPYLLSICVIFLHTVFSWAKFLAISGQLSTVAMITHPRYFKEVAIYREAPYWYGVTWGIQEVICWELFINTNLWMDIYGCILLRRLKTGYRARNRNKYVVDSVIHI